MMLTCPIQPEDLEKYAPQGLLTVLRKLPENQLSRIFKIYKDDQVLALGGVVKLRDGVGEAWIVIPDLLEARKHVIQFVRACMRHLGDVARAEGFWRIQATAKDSDVRAQEFLRVMGFNQEGLLNWYGQDKSDHILFSALYA